MLDLIKLDYNILYLYIYFIFDFIIKFFVLLNLE